MRGGDVREFRDGGDRFCMGAFNQKMTRQKIKFHSCRVTSSSCALVLLHSQPPSKPHSSNTIPGLFTDTCFLSSGKNECIYTKLDNYQANCSGEYFKRVNFMGKGNTHLKCNIEVAHVEEKYLNEAQFSVN